MEKTYTWVEAREVATNGALNDQRDSFERSKKSSWDDNKGQRTKTDSSPIKDPITVCLLICRKVQRKLSPQKRMQEALSHPKDVWKQAIARYVQVRRVHKDCESSCEIIYKICFGKLNPTIKATNVYLKTPLVGFSRERSWSVGEVPLEILIGDAPFLRTETLNFVIVRSDSPHNMLLGRTAMQRMGIVGSTIHGAIKFHTKKGSKLYFRQTKPMKERRGPKGYLPQVRKGSLVVSTLGKKFIMNDKYPDQTVTIRKQLHDHFKKELQNLLKSNVDVFSWTYDDMTGILRTKMIEGQPFNTEHKLNKYSHIMPIKQNKRGLGPDRSMAASVNMSLTDINASLTEHNLHQQCKLFSRGNSSTQQWEHFFTSSGKITLAVGTILHYQWQNNSSSRNSTVRMIFTNSGKILH
nr:hypothetical protein [Tanacetum cinerariifolium]